MWMKGPEKNPSIFMAEKISRTRPSVSHRRLILRKKCPYPVFGETALVL
jgi:hypothetical protein